MLISPKARRRQIIQPAKSCVLPTRELRTRSEVRYSPGMMQTLRHMGSWAMPVAENIRRAAQGELPMNLIPATAGQAMP